MDEQQLLDKLHLLGNSIVETILDQTDGPAEAATVATFVMSKVCIITAEACDKPFDDTLAHAMRQLETGMRILAGDEE